MGVALGVRGRGSLVRHFALIMDSNGITAWAGIVRVDGDAYVWMGAPDINAPLATQTAYTYTSTKSIFTFDVDGKITLNATFTSPVYPTDFKRQSLAFSYLSVEVESLDGSSHDVQLYTDISAGKRLS